MDCDYDSVAEHVSAISKARDDVVIAKDELAEAKDALKGHPGEAARQQPRPERQAR